MSRRSVQLVLVVLGAVIVLGHLIALAFLGMTTSNWLSGTVIGLVLAVVGGAHLLLARGSDGSSSRWQQVVFGLIALAAGVIEGLIATTMSDLSWWLLLPWIATALAIGMLLAGPPVEKAARLAAFGFSSVLIARSGVGPIEGLTGFLALLGWSILGAAGAIGVGALAHTVVGRVHASQ